MFVLNFYSPVFVDQLKRGRKTATIRLGDKGKKYSKGEVVMITVGFQHSPRERIFEAVIDSVDEHDRGRLAAPRQLGYRGRDHGSSATSGTKRTGTIASSSPSRKRMSSSRPPRSTGHMSAAPGAS